MSPNIEDKKLCLVGYKAQKEKVEYAKGGGKKIVGRVTKKVPKIRAPRLTYDQQKRIFALVENKTTKWIMWSETRVLYSCFCVLLV